MIEGGSRLNRKSPSPDRPLVSIITVVYNGVHRLEETISSVLRFKTGEIEYIVVDGGSTDGTVGILQKYDAFIDYWSSEPDNGIYDAINKGIGYAKGKYYYILNLGDQILDLPVDQVRQAAFADADVVLFNVELSNRKIFESKIDYRSRFGNTIHHQGAFYKTDMEIRYNVRYKVYADFDFNLNLLKQRRKFVRFNKTISYHTLDGISNEKKYWSEYLKVIRHNSGTIYSIIGYLYVRQGEVRARAKALWSRACSSLFPIL